MTTAQSIHAPIPNQPAAMVVEDGVYLARFPFSVAGEIAAFKAARAWVAKALRDGSHPRAEVNEYEGHLPVPPFALKALLKAKVEIEAHWTRDELSDNWCGMEVALDQINEALRQALGLQSPISIDTAMGLLAGKDLVEILLAQVMAK